MLSKENIELLKQDKGIILVIPSVNPDLYKSFEIFAYEEGTENRPDCIDVVTLRGEPVKLGAGSLSVGGVGYDLSSASITPQQDGRATLWVSLTGTKESGDLKIYIVRGDQRFVLEDPTPVKPEYFDGWQELAKELAARNSRLGLSSPFAPKKPSSPPRNGEKPQIKPANLVRVPTTEPMKDLLTVLYHPDWKASKGGDALTQKQGDSAFRIDCDTSLGFDAPAALATIARLGPAVAQTFLAMTGLWLERQKGQHSESYLTVRASDLLRYMGRSETPKGGYHNEDILAKGREIWLIDRISVPRANVTRGNKQSVTLSRFFMIKYIDMQRTLFEGTPQSVVEFRYHLNDELYQWVGGDAPQYREVSGKILRYHPERDKYHILIGFCLAYYDRVNARKGGEKRQISLPALLKMAGIDVPSRNVPRFIAGIERAISDLSADGVIPGAVLTGPATSNQSSRQIVAGLQLTYPRLLQPKAEN